MKTVDDAFHYDSKLLCLYLIFMPSPSWGGGHFHSEGAAYVTLAVTQKRLIFLISMFSHAARPIFFSNMTPNAPYFQR